MGLRQANEGLAAKAEEATQKISMMTREHQDMLDRLRENKVQVTPKVSANLYKLLDNKKVWRQTKS